MTIAYLLVLLVLAIYGAHRLYLTVSYWTKTSQPRAEPVPFALPLITVQLPLFNERYVATRLLDAVARLDWPRDRLEIQVLDDSTDETSDLCRRHAQMLRKQGFRVHHMRRADRVGFKAGALQAGLTRAEGEFLLILDADFVPPPDLLRQTIGHFSDATVGMVQSRWEHINRRQSLLTRVQALLLDGHFAIEQRVRHDRGLFFNFNGTAGVWRRQAIVSAGGWQHDTLTEDLDLSYRALLVGWRFVYLPALAAPAELPMHMNGFKSQQFRWAKGSVQVARKVLPRLLRSELPLGTKIEGFFHLTQNIPYLITLALVLLGVPALVLSDATSTSPRWLELLLIAGTAVSLGSYCATSQVALLWSRKRHPASLLELLITLPALVAITVGISVNQSRAVLEGLVGIDSPFIRTPKHGVSDRGAAGPISPRYLAGRNLVSLAEMALALFFAIALVAVASAGNWSVAPILGIFFVGFAYVAIRSLGSPG